MIKFLKIIGWVIAIAGVIIAYGNLKGWFIDKNRQEIYKQLLSESSKYKVSLETPGVNTFLEKYYYSKNIPSYMQSQPIIGDPHKYDAFWQNRKYANWRCCCFV